MPIDVAVEKGATEIFALDILRDGPADDGHWNVVEVATLSLMDLIAQQRNRDLSIYSSYPGVNLHYLLLYASMQLAFDDFDHAAELITDEWEAARAYLSELKSSGAIRKINQPQKNVTHLLTQRRDFLVSLVSNLSLSGQS